MLILLAVLVSFSLAPAQTQVREGDWPNSGILYTATNPKYHLVCEFRGTKAVTPKGDPPYDRIYSVVVRNEQTGEAVEYNPPGERLPNFANHDVWSPDGEWLVLPLRPYAGFQLIKASDALEELKHSNPKEFLRLEGRKHQYKDALFHDFLGWQSPASFNFNVTEDLHTTSTYQFNLTNFQLAPAFLGAGVADTYITSRGVASIQVSPLITAPHLK